MRSLTKLAVQQQTNATTARGQDHPHDDSAHAVGGTPSPMGLTTHKWSGDGFLAFVWYDHGSDVLGDFTHTVNTDFFGKDTAVVGGSVDVVGVAFTVHVFDEFDARQINPLALAHIDVFADQWIIRSEW